MDALLQAFRFRLTDCIASLAYLTALLLNVVTARIDAELSYAVKRNASLFTSQHTGSSDVLPLAFQGRVDSWFICNAAKCAALLVAWVMVRSSMCAVYVWDLFGHDRQQLLDAFEHFLARTHRGAQHAAC